MFFRYYIHLHILRLQPPMKFGIIRALALLVFFVTLSAADATNSFGQARPSSKSNVISIDPLSFFANEPATLQYEIKAGPVNSWAFRLHYWTGLTGGSETWSGFGVGGAYRFYIADSRALTGLSVEPAASLMLFSGTIAAGTGHKAVALLIGGDIEYKWIFDQFSIEPIVGLRIGYTPSNPAPQNATGFIAIIGIGAGYAF